MQKETLKSIYHLSIYQFQFHLDSSSQDWELFWSVPLLQFKGVPGPTYTLWKKVPGPRVFIPLSHHAVLGVLFSRVRAFSYTKKERRQSWLQKLPSTCMVDTSSWVIIDRIIWIWDLNTYRNQITLSLQNLKLNHIIVYKFFSKIIFTSHSSRIFKFKYQVTNFMKY